MTSRFSSMPRVFVRRMGLPALCLSLGVLAEAYVLALYAPARVTAIGPHRSPVGEFSAGIPVRQTFVSSADGLERIHVMLSAPDPALAAIAWELSERQEGTWTRRHGGVCRFRLPRGSSWQTIEFPALPESAGHSYALEIRLIRIAGAPLPAGIAPIVTLDNPLRDGYVSVNSQSRWGDLVFEAVARGDTIAGRFALQVMPALAKPFDRAATWVALLMVLNVLVATITASVMHPARRRPS